MFLRKALKTLLILVALGATFVSNQTPAFAGFTPSDCTTANEITAIEFEDEYPQGFGRIAVRAANLGANQHYFLAIFRDNSATMWRLGTSEQSVQFTGSPIELPVNIPTLNDTAENAQVWLMKDGTAGNEKICQVGTVTIQRSVQVQCEISVTQERPIDGTTKTCDVMNDDTKCVEKARPLNVTVKMRDESGNPISNRRVNVDIAQQNFCIVNCYGSDVSDSEGVAIVNFNTGMMPKGTGALDIRVSVDTVGGDYIRCQDVEYNLTEGMCKNEENKPICGNELGLQPIDEDDDPDGATVYAICNQINDGALRAKCESCAGGTTGREGVWTAVGCIKRDPESIIGRLIQIGLGMGGGVSLLMTLAGGFILSTSQGDPQRTNQAKEMITSAIIGLLFVIFSVVILQFIGVTILQIPGFGSVETN